MTKQRQTIVPDCSRVCAEMTSSAQHNGRNENATESMQCIPELIHNWMHQQWMKYLHFTPWSLACIVDNDRQI